MKLWIVLISLGVSLLAMCIYELIAGRAYGVKKHGRVSEVNSRWISRKEEPYFYWKILSSRAFGALFLIGVAIYELVTSPS